MRNTKTGYKTIHNYQFTINYSPQCSPQFSPTSRESSLSSYSMVSWSGSSYFQCLRNTFRRISIRIWTSLLQLLSTYSIYSCFSFWLSFQELSQKLLSCNLSRSLLFSDSEPIWPMNSPRWVWWGGGVGIWLRSIQHGEQCWLLLLLS